MSGSAEPSDDMSSPVLLNSFDFPALRVPQRPDTLITTSYSSMTKSVFQRAQSKKRPMVNDDEQILDEDSLCASQNSSADSLNSPSSTVKKSRICLYRDPPPILQSLDSDSIKTLFESPTLSDSQNSESGLWSPSWTNPRKLVNNSCNENLGSLGDIIQKYSIATLNSIKGIEIIGSGSSQTSSSVVSSDFIETKHTSIIREEQLRLEAGENNNSLKLPSVALTNTSYDTFTSAEDSKNESYHKLTQSNLMAITSDTSHADIHQNSSLNVSVSDQSGVLLSYEKLMSSSSDVITTEFSEINTAARKKLFITKENNTKTDNQDSGGRNVDIGDSVNNKKKNQLSSAEVLPELFEADLKEYKKCKKNKNHTQFYSVPDLQVRDLPDEIRHEDSVTFLSCLSQLVVQIAVHSTSSARGSEDMYSSYIGTNKKRNGSGFIASVEESIRKYRCMREDCPHAVPFEDFSSSFEDSGTMTPPSLNRSVSSVNTSLNRSISNTSNSSSTFDRSISNISTASSSSNSSSGSRTHKHFFYGGVYIHTNKHVIFDKSEADNAYVKFFFNTPQGKEVVHGHVASIAGVNNFQDHVVLHVMSHDKNLFNTIGMCVHNAKSNYKQMLHSTDTIQQCVSCNHNHSWVAIIAHPHGMAKKITFGRVMKEITEGIRITKYYDAATCPGSSGGLVITPSLLRLQWPGAVHSCTDKKTGYNISFDSRCQDLNATDMGRIHKTVLSRNMSNSEDIFKL